MLSRPGTYALILASSSEASLIIGKLGRLELRAGCYVYVGSAFGPGGLNSRISRHRKKTGPIHWHIDYLKTAVCLNEIWVTCDPVRREHQWAELIAEGRNASTPMLGFGSSDCGCESHLFFFSSRPSGNYFKRKVHSKFQDHKKLFILKETKD